MKVGGTAGTVKSRKRYIPSVCPEQEHENIYKNYLPALSPPPCNCDACCYNTFQHELDKTKSVYSHKTCQYTQKKETKDKPHSEAEGASGKTMCGLTPMAQQMK